MPTFQKKPNGFFLIGQTDTPLAEITFQRPNAHHIVIDHTFVDESLGGQGLGRQLVMQVVDLAKEEHKTLDATCPFAKQVLDRLAKARLADN